MNNKNNDKDTPWRLPYNILAKAETFKTDSSVLSLNDTNAKTTTKTTLAASPTPSLQRLRPLSFLNLRPNYQSAFQIHQEDTRA